MKISTIEILVVKKDFVSCSCLLVIDQIVRLHCLRLEITSQSILHSVDVKSNME